MKLSLHKLAARLLIGTYKIVPTLTDTHTPGSVADRSVINFSKTGINCTMYHDMRRCNLEVKFVIL